MKTYNQFITELNKVELAMKAGKLGVKALKKIGLIPATKKVPVKDITKFRNSPSSKIVSPRRKVENVARAIKNPEALPGGKLNTAKRQTQFRGKNKADANYFDTLTPNIMRTNKILRAKGLKEKPLRRGLGDHPGYLDASKQLNQPASVHKNFKATFSDQYPRNKFGNLNTKSVKYDKVPDSIENKIRGAIMSRKKK